MIQLKNCSFGVKQQSHTPRHIIFLGGNFRIHKDIEILTTHLDKSLTQHFQLRLTKYFQIFDFYHYVSDQNK
jgi:hypothetical protein